jgi:hypothetical protein
MRTGIQFLTTRISKSEYRADYDGAMIRALRDKGWERAGKTTPSQAGNRPAKAIRKRAKWQFLCPIVGDAGEQTRLGRWS